MRHRNHKHQLGVKKAHRLSLMANLAVAIIRHGRIKTTLAKAKALRPFIEKIITLSKKAAATENMAEKLHYRRLAISKIRDPKAVALLFDKKVQEFTDRAGGYTRIYKLVPRLGDAASMALIDFIDASDEGYASKRKKRSRKTIARAKSLKEANEEPVAVETEDGSDHQNVQKTEE